MGPRLILVLLMIAAVPVVEAQLSYYGGYPWGGYGPGMWGYRPWWWWRRPFFGPMMWGGYGMMPWMYGGWKRK